MKRLLAALLLFTALACSKEKKSTRWDEAADAATQRTTSATASATAPVAEGSNFNAAFPKDGDDGYKRVFTQEKDGFAEAKLQKDGKDVATLSVADTNANAEAKTKFADAKEKLGDSPMMTVGKNQTTVLVGGRWQVKVSSQTLDHEARKAILGKFDLGKLPQ